MQMNFDSKLLKNLALIGLAIITFPLSLAVVPFYLMHLNSSGRKKQAIQKWYDWNEQLDTARSMADFPIAFKLEKVANVPEFSDNATTSQCNEIAQTIRMYEANNENTFLFADAQMQIFLYLKYGLDKQLNASLRFVAGHIVAIDLAEGARTMRTETQIQSVTRDAFTGIMDERKMTGTTTSTGHEQQGEVTLRISTVSPEVPIITISMEPVTGRDWAARIQRLIAMRSIPTPQTKPLQQQHPRTQAG